MFEVEGAEQVVGLRVLGGGIEIGRVLCGPKTVSTKRASELWSAVSLKMKPGRA